MRAFGNFLNSLSLQRLHWIPLNANLNFTPYYFYFVLQELQRLLSLGLMMKSTQADVAKFVRQALSKAT